MDEPTPPLRPFIPGQPAADDADSEKRTPSRAKSSRPPSPKAGAPPAPSAGESGAPDRPASPSPFATPEPLPSRGRVMEKQVVPEVAEEEEEHEEALILPAQALPARRRASFSADRFEPGFVVLLFLLSTAAVIATSGSVGMCWDEAYYVEAGQRTLAWFSRASQAPTPAAGGDADPYWDAYSTEPRGHPSVTRFLVALGMAFADRSGSPLFAMRVPIAACFGLTLVFIYLLARHCFGRVAAWISTMAYFFMPQVFGHAHFAVTDTPTVLMTVAVVYAFVRGLERPSWAIVCGILFGVALATKINALMLVPILLPWALVYRRRESLNNLYSLLFLAPVSVCAVWPWMWKNPIENFLKYLLWNARHTYTGTFYLGNAYNFDSPLGPVPWHYPLVMIALTVPVSILFLAVFGLARTIRSPRRHAYAVLVVWAAALPCLVQMAGIEPKYDGVRLFLPVFPFIAILAGVGGGIWVRIGAFFDRGTERLPRGQIVLAVAIFLIALEGGLGMVKVNPYSLSYFNAIARGPEGARRKGMEIAYWGDALNRRALDEINLIVPDGATLMPLAMNEAVLSYCQEWGWLKPGIVLVPAGRGPADYHLLQYRFGLFKRPEWTLYEDYPRMIEFGLPKVPLMGLYETGIEFENRWPRKLKH